MGRGPRPLLPQDQERRARLPGVRHTDEPGRPLGLHDCIGFTTLVNDLRPDQKLTHINSASKLVPIDRLSSISAPKATLILVMERALHEAGFDTALFVSGENDYTFAIFSGHTACPGCATPARAGECVSGNLWVP